MSNSKSRFLVATLFLGTAFAQSDFRQEWFELSPFAGGVGYKKNVAGPGTDFTTGSALGFRVTENLWRHFGIEETFAWHRNKLEFLTPVTAGSTSPPLQSREYRASVDGLFYFTPRGSRIRPFVSMGLGTSRFTLTDESRRFVSVGLRPAGQFVNPQTLLQFNYGGGVKIRINDLLSVRGDIRGLTSKNPTLGFQTFANGGAWIPGSSRLQAAEVSGGIVFNFGPRGDNGGRPTLRISKDFSVVGITTDPASALVEAQGVLINTPIRFKADVRNPKNRKLRYQWTIDGQAAGSDSDTLVYTPTVTGAHRAQLQVSEADKANPQFAAEPNPVTVYAKAPPPPPSAPEHRLTIGPITVDPANATRGVTGAANNSLTGLNNTNSVSAGTGVRLSAEARDTLGHTPTFTWLANGNQVGTGNPFSYTPAQPGWYRIELRVVDPGPNGATAAPVAPVTLYVRDVRSPAATCAASNATLTLGQTSNLSVVATVPQGHTARIRWTVSEGSVANPAAAQTAFNANTVNFPANPQVQTKSITATATVTDDYGQTANCTTTVRVSTEPQAVHYGDILFGAGSSRVDNAAKRVLIERVYPELTGPYQGYVLALIGHSDERERGIANLDRNRVRNAAAVLTAGRRTCMSLEPTRIQADWIGQTESEYKDSSGLADTRGSRINRNDPRARNRRVELWLVPAGKPMPGAMKAPKSLDARDLRPLGCPQ